MNKILAIGGAVIKIFLICGTMVGMVEFTFKVRCSILHVITF